MLQQSLRRVRVRDWRWRQSFPFRKRAAACFASTDAEQPCVTTAVKPMDLRRVYKYLQLESFDEQEFERVFDKIRSTRTAAYNHGNNEPDTAHNDAVVVIDQDHVRDFMIQRIQELEQENGMPSAHDDETTRTLRFNYADQEACRLLQIFDTSGRENPMIDKQLFSSQLLLKASSVDMKRTLPITVSMLLVGSSVGIITPVMPFVVENLGLTPGQYGMVVSAFAAAKMSCNVPSAILVERHGRKVRRTTVCE